MRRLGRRATFETRRTDLVNSHIDAQITIQRIEIERFTRRALRTSHHEEIAQAKQRAGGFAALAGLAIGRRRPD